MKILKYLLLLFLFFTLYCRENLSNREGEEGSPKKVILASILPMKVIASEIAGDLYEIDCIIDRPADPHSFEIRPGEAKQIEDSFVFVFNGGGLEFWAENFISNKRSAGGHVIDTSEGIPSDLLIFSHQHQHNHHHEYDYAYSSHQLSPNPHFWLDPMIAVYQAEMIASELSSIDPINKDIYMDNLSRFKLRMVSLDAEISSRISELPHRSFIEYHSAFIYFAKRYDLTLYDVLLHSPDTLPSPKKLSRLINDFNEGKYYGIFGEVHTQNQELETISMEVGKEIVLLDPMGFSIDPPAEIYEDLIVFNLNQIERGLR